MTRLVRWAAWLYPPDWRARYGAEFEALLEDAGTGWRELGDVVKGAVLMHFNARSITAITAVCGVIGLAAAAIAFSIHDRYVSTAVLRLGGPTPEAQSSELRHLAEHVLGRDSLAGIIQKYGLYPEERKRIPLEDIVQEMRRNIMILPIRKAGHPLTAPADAIQIRFSYPDKAIAQAVTRELTTGLLQGSLPVLSLEVLDPASLPQQPSYPNRTSFLIAGLGIGLAAGAIVTAARRWRIVAATGLAGALLAAAIYLVLPKTWVSSAVVHVMPAEAAAPIAAGLRRAGGEVEAGAIQGMPGVIYLKSSNRNPRLAQDAVRQSLTRMTQDHPLQIVAIDVLDPASLPDQPQRPNRARIVFAGLAAGLLAGGVWQRRRASAALPAASKI